jgi:hypothetical protein
VSYSQILPERTTSDTIICLNSTEVRALLKLKVERDYLKKQYTTLITSDSLKSCTITDQEKSINKLTLNLADTENKYAEQLSKKENWRNAALIGIPVSILSGLILSIFL